MSMVSILLPTHFWVQHPGLEEAQIAADMERILGHQPQTHEWRRCRWFPAFRFSSWNLRPHGADTSWSSSIKTEFWPTGSMTTMNGLLFATHIWENLLCGLSNQNNDLQWPQTECPFPHMASPDSSPCCCRDRITPPPGGGGWVGWGYSHGSLDLGSYTDFTGRLVVLRAAGRRENTSSQYLSACIVVL